MKMDKDVLLGQWKQIDLCLEEREAISYALKSPPWKFARKMSRSPFAIILVLLGIFGVKFSTNCEKIAKVWAMGDRAQILLIFAFFLPLAIFVEFVYAERKSRVLEAACSVIKKLDDRGFVVNSDLRDSSNRTRLE